LVLLQVACLELHRAARSRGQAVIGQKDLERFFGDPDLLRAYAEGLVALVLPRPSDRAAFEKLLARMYVRQPGGSLTTALVPVADVAREWTGKAPFEEVVRVARRIGLLRDGTFPTADGGGRRCLSLGHDSLARVAAEWDRPPCCNAGPWKKATLTLALVLLALLTGLAALVAYWGYLEEPAEEAPPENPPEAPFGALPPHHPPGPVPGGGDLHLPTTYLARATLHDPKGGDKPVHLRQPTASVAGTHTWAVKDAKAVQQLGKELGVATRPGQEFRLVVSREVEIRLLGSRNVVMTETERWLFEYVVLVTESVSEVSVRQAGAVERIRFKIQWRIVGRKYRELR
jgi:hypothetical protein